MSDSAQPWRSSRRNQSGIDYKLFSSTGTRAADKMEGTAYNIIQAGEPTVTDSNVNGTPQASSHGKGWSAWWPPTPVSWLTRNRNTRREPVKPTLSTIQEDVLSLDPASIISSISSSSSSEEESEAESEKELEKQAQLLCK